MRARFLLTDEVLDYVRRDAEACAESDPKMSDGAQRMHILTLSRQGMPWEGRKHWYEAYENVSHAIWRERYKNEHR